jgi:hypothetical protein
MCKSLCMEIEFVAKARGIIGTTDSHFCYCDHEAKSMDGENSQPDAAVLADEHRDTWLNPASSTEKLDGCFKGSSPRTGSRAIQLTPSW